MNNSDNSYSRVKRFLRLVAWIALTFVVAGLWIDLITKLSVTYPDIFTIVDVKVDVEDAKDFYRMGNQLIVLGIFIFAVMVVIMSYVIRDEERRPRRNDLPPRREGESGLWID